jgi:uncharacterized damage-inducible protein DinB
MSVEVDDLDLKNKLHDYLKRGREALLWKLEGLSEYDLRAPRTRTGTNLLGLVKHLAGVELDYFGEVFDRPHGIPLPWNEHGAPNADMWATPEESTEEILGLYHQATAHADKTIDELAIDAEGYVAWWSHGTEGRWVTLGWILTHVATETHRHAGHADILRELIDGEAGLRPETPNLPPMRDDDWWAAYRAEVQAAADTFRTS